MTPTLMGRIQTRFFLLFTVGLLWTALIVPVLPKGGATVIELYIVAIIALVVAAVVGIAWEFLYHLIQQYRWEKDWPILLGLLVGIPESITTFLVVDAIVIGGPALVGFFIHFLTTWLVVWLVANGPMRVIFLRWRYRGGRIV